MSKLNTDIRDAIENLYHDRARELIREALKDANAETYFLASQVALDDDQRKSFLQKSLDLDPFYAPAYKAMQAFKPKDAIQVAAPAAPVVSMPAPVAAAAPAPVVATPAPAPVQVASPPPPQTLIAKIGHSTTLYQYPWPKAPVRSNISSNTVCIPLARTESGRWINVLYMGTTGHEVLGWIEAHDLSEVKFGNNGVSLYDLPITQFEYNSKQDIVELSKKVQNAFGWAYLLSMLIIFAAFYGLVAGATYRYNTPSEISEAMTARYIGFGLAGVLLLLTINAARNASIKITSNLGGSAMNWAQRLNSIRRGKQSATENVMEDQARIAAMQIGGSLANTYLSKKMTSKSDVTIRYR
ncbi:MAG: hypothetical protein L6Q98_22745 [Anaerolineae bacterium]|nr:hypothetical protein [Anaerolineae bacterium]NUQ05206.1 hypothetical protein [Anaerolineae bacterium]